MKGGENARRVVRILLLAIVGCLAVLEWVGDRPERETPQAPPSPQFEGHPTSRTAAVAADPGTPGRADGRSTGPRSGRSGPRREEGTGSESAGTAVHDRATVYEVLARTGDPEEAALCVEALRRAYGPALLAVVDGDFRAAIEDEDLDVLSVTAGLISEEERRRAGGDQPVALERTLAWLDLLPVSDPAARAVRGILLRSDAAAAEHIDRIVELWRADLGSATRRACAIDLLEWAALLLGDPEPFLALVDDSDRMLRDIAWQRLVALDPGEFLPRALAVAGVGPVPERSRFLTALLPALPADLRAECLLDWHERWPDAQLDTAWLHVGAADGRALERAYRATESATTREQILVGWTQQSLDPVLAERFLTEVFDTDPAREVRAQSLIALGTVDDPAARDRLVEAAGEDDVEDPLYAAHLSAGVRNALATAPRAWVDRFALPFARDRVRGLSPSARPRELARWCDALRRRFPELVDELTAAIGSPER